MRLVAVTIFLLALAGCETATAVADDVARAQAKTAVNQAISTRFPGVDASPVTDCVIEGASAAEILTIAGNAATGRTDANVTLVTEILQRPAVSRCAATAMAQLVVGRL